jgi:hypothetical protein
MLRFIIGLILLLLTVAFPVGALADSEPLDNADRNLTEGFEQLLHPRHPSEEENERLRLEEEYRQHEEQKALELKRMLVEQRAFLAHVGPTFEVSSFGGGRLHLLAACLIGESGKKYLYDPGEDTAAQATSMVDEREFSKAANLAKSIGHVKWQPQPATADFGVVVWTMSFDGRTTLLQIVGDYLGTLPDPQVGELVKLIDDWCPYAGEIKLRLELFKRLLPPPY